MKSTVGPKLAVTQLKKIGWIKLYKCFSVYIFTNGDKTVSINFDKELTKLKFSVLLIHLRGLNKELESKMKLYPGFYRYKLERFYGDNSYSFIFWSIAVIICLVYLGRHL